jgi:hypothetical protein
MFALNFLLESAMHEGVIQLFNSRSQSLQTLNSFRPGFQLQIPITQHLNYRLNLFFNLRSWSWSQSLQILTSIPPAFQLPIPIFQKLNYLSFTPTFELQIPSFLHLHYYSKPELPLHSLFNSRSRSLNTEITFQTYFSTLPITSKTLTAFKPTFQIPIPINFWSYFWERSS